MLPRPDGRGRSSMNSRLVVGAIQMVGMLGVEYLLSKAATCIAFLLR